MRENVGHALGSELHAGERGACTGLGHDGKHGTPGRHAPRAGRCGRSRRRNLLLVVDLS